jgi:predicted dehydrogenase
MDDTAVEVPKVRFGLVGCGRIGATGDERAAAWPHAHLWLPYAHASAISACKGAELWSVCDVNESAAKAAGERFSARATYTDYRRMFEGEPLEAVAVATRTAERPAIIEQALHKGIRALYCEKPLANSLEAADGIRRLVKEHAAFFSYGVKRRFMPVFQQARDLVLAGEIGELLEVTVRLGRGPLLWSQPHSVDIACFFARDAEVEYVQGDLEWDSLALSDGMLDADPQVRRLYIRFSNGIAGHVVPTDGYDVEMTGTAGRLAIRSDGLELHGRYRIPTQPDNGLFLKESLLRNVERCSGTLNSIQTLCSALRGRGAADYDVGLAVRNMEILFAAVYSHLDAGRRIPFPLERRGLTITGRSGHLLV